jgi:hypothetical protein
LSEKSFFVGEFIWFQSLEEFMSSNHKKENQKHVRVELKYCEHCGGLWVREGGAGVYCDRCAPKVADLPAPKKGAGRLTLPVAKRPAVEESAFEIPDSSDLEAAVGVA